MGWLENRRHHLARHRFLAPLPRWTTASVLAHTGFNTHLDKNEVLLYYIANGELTPRRQPEQSQCPAPGEALCLHTGTGLRHSEVNQSSAPLRLVGWLFRLHGRAAHPTMEGQRFCGKIV